MQRLFSFAFITTVALKSFENKDWAKNGGGGGRKDRRREEEIGSPRRHTQRRK